MDSISQAALGATIGGAVLGTRLGRKALLGGALLGTLPDLDSFIDYGDAVTNFTAHRGFSHSVLLLLPLALLLAWLAQRWRPAIGYGRWALFCGLVLVTHPLLDAFTTYGTQLFWPFAGPVGLNSIFIIDPLYTLPLLIACCVALWRPGRARPLLLGLAFSTVYLGWSLLGQALMTQRVMPTLAAYELTTAPRLVQPMPFSTLLWRVTVMGPEQRLELVTGFLDDGAPPQVQVYPRQLELVESAAELPAGQRLLWFTDGFLRFEVIDGVLTATDLRLGIPGNYPFTFALGVRDDDRWNPLRSYLLPRPGISSEAWQRLWLRILGQTTGTHPSTVSGSPEP